MQGRYDREDQDSSGLVSIAVAGPDDSQPGMAAAAGRVALARSGYRGADVGLLLHAVTAYNGLDGWNAGCYLQQEMLGGSGLSFEIRQLSNGAVASIELAAAYLAASPASGAAAGGSGECDAAMITAADQFAEPAWDRWRTTWGLVYADGASAAVVSRGGGFARVLSSVTVTDSGLEGLHRGGLPFGPCPDASDYPIDFRARALDYGQSVDTSTAPSSTQEDCLTSSICRSRTGADCQPDLLAEFGGDVRALSFEQRTHGRGGLPDADARFQLCEDARGAVRVGTIEGRGDDHLKIVQCRQFELARQHSEDRSRLAPLGLVLGGGGGGFCSGAPPGCELGAPIGRRRPLLVGRRLVRARRLTPRRARRPTRVVRLVRACADGQRERGSA